MPAVVDAGAVKAELHAASLTAAEEQVEADRRRHAERLAACAAAEAAREQDLLIRDGVPMSHWPKHTDGYRRWKRTRTSSRPSMRAQGKGPGRERRGPSATGSGY
jgi:hypothetical protein